MKLQRITLIETPQSFNVQAMVLDKKGHGKYLRSFKTHEEAEKHVEYLNANALGDEDKQWIGKISKYGGKV